MGSSGLGAKRKAISKHRISLDSLPRTCGRLFLDSGAHSLYNLHAQSRTGPAKFAWFGTGTTLTRRFRKVCDQYAEFVKAHRDGIDHYATMDVIFNPQLSWESYRYLRDEHGLNPVPVVHYGTPTEWAWKYVNADCKYLGVGGIGQEATYRSYTKWADELFRSICPKVNGYLPVVRTHGFAMTSVPLMCRYPWWSVDSSRWAKAAGYGSILVPHMRNGEFTFTEDPYLCCLSYRTESIQRDRNHFCSWSDENKQKLTKWLDRIDMPLGRIKENKKTGEFRATGYGVASRYHARAVANLRFFQALADSRPKWPWPFTIYVQRGLFDVQR